MTAAYAGPMAADVIEVWRPDLATYHRLVEVGAFEDVRVELLDGVIAAMSPKGRAHEQALTYLTRVLVESIERPLEVRVQCGLSLDDRWEPEPDLAVVDPDAPRPYHPAGALLVCEVAQSSLRRDRTIKRSAYARFGVPEYWVVALPDRRIDMYGDPRDGDYTSCGACTDGRLESTVLPGLIVDMAELWSAALR